MREKPDWERIGRAVEHAIRRDVPVGRVIEEMRARGASEKDSLIAASQIHCARNFRAGDSKR